MKQLAFGILLLAALLLGGIVSSCGIRWVQAPITAQLQQAAEAGLGEDWEQADALCDAAKTRWETYRHALAAVIDHGPMEEIDSLFGEMDVLRQAKDRVLFSSLCRRVSLLTQAIGESLSLNWWNLL